MRWQTGRRSSNIEDRRGFPVKTAGGGALFFMAAVVYMLGGDPTNLVIEGVNRSIQSSGQSSLTPAEQEQQADFVSAVLGGTEDVWGELFAQQGLSYEQPALVLYTGYVDSACGTGQAAMGPFYCPIDQKVYLDLEFFHELEYRHDSPGDFARAYVIAHEIGHHVQNLTGVLNESRSNEQSVKTELQADCYAGVWAAHMGNVLEKGDIEEALNAASQIGDDVLQEQAQGYVVPDSFTHGSSAQRHEWFQRGYKNGAMNACRS